MEKHHELPIGRILPAAAQNLNRCLQKHSVIKLFLNLKVFNLGSGRYCFFKWSIPEYTFWSTEEKLSKTLILDFELRFNI